MTALRAGLQVLDYVTKVPSHAVKQTQGSVVVRPKPLHFCGFALLQRNSGVHSLTDLENDVKLFMRSLRH